MSFRISGLDPAPFAHLYGQPDAVLARHDACRVVADAAPGFPDRVELRDAAPGEPMLLLNFTHMPLASPYRASHAIYVREGAARAAAMVDEIPEVLRIRTLSLRAFDAAGMMRQGELAEGAALAPLIADLLADPGVAFVHAHFAKRGCYAARIERA